MSEQDEERIREEIREKLRDKQKDFVGKTDEPEKDEGNEPEGPPATKTG
jgi:hypothetical protein